MMRVSINRFAAGHKDGWVINGSMLRRTALLFVLCWLPLLLSAQRDAFWHFGDSVVLKWDASGPVVMPKSALDGFEASSSMSDTAGNLLFYTNGNRIWNSDDMPILSGDSLIPSVGQDPMGTMTQGTLVLPFPETPSKYVLVLTGGIPHIRSLYTVLDMDLNSGLGDLVPGERRILLDSLGLSEKTTAVRHANGRDWWVVQYRNFEPITGFSDSTFKFYLLSPNGLVYSHAQTIGLDGASFRIGEMVFSEDGSLLGMAGLAGVQVYGFDRCSGLLTEPKMRLGIEGGYGAAFSPNGRFFYFTTSFKKELYQYDLLSDGNADTLSLLGTGTGMLEFGQLQLVMDKKIYMAVNNLTSNSALSEYLHVINEPDVYGISCDFQPFSFYMDGRIASGGLPNMVNYELGRLEGSPCDTVYAVDTTTTITTPPLDLDFTVIPTVSDGHYWLDGPSAEGQSVSAAIYDVNGRLVWQAEDWLPLFIDLTGQTAGIYVLRASRGRHVWNTTIVLH